MYQELEQLIPFAKWMIFSPATTLLSRALSINILDMLEENFD